jgi:hypothetical protein
MEPVTRPFDTEGKQSLYSPRTAPIQRLTGIPQERLGEQIEGIWPDTWQISNHTLRQTADMGYAEIGKDTAELVFNNIGQRADDNQIGRCIRRQRRHNGHQRGETGVFTLGESGFDAAA